MTLDHVYHASHVHGLRIIAPHSSSHGHRWVYATKDLVMSAIFLGTLGGDFTCAVGRASDTGRPYICERFVGAFDLRYSVEGSIYILPGDKFLEGRTQWEEEVVCEEPVIPLQEIKVDSAKDYLLQLEKSGEIMIRYYPDRVADIPDDDEDLVERATLWYTQFGDPILARVKQYHPQLLQRVLLQVQEQSGKTA